MIEGDREKLVRAIRKECFRMDRRARADLVQQVETLGGYWIVYRKTKRFHRIYGHDRFPVAFSLSPWVIMNEDGIGSLRMGVEK